MTEPHDGLRRCPTRADGTEAFISQLVTLDMCQGRQRERYHKCPTCQHCNERRGEQPPVAKPGTYARARVG